MKVVCFALAIFGALHAVPALAADDDSGDFSRHNRFKMPIRYWRQEHDPLPKVHEVPHSVRPGIVHATSPLLGIDNIIPSNPSAFGLPRNDMTVASAPFPTAAKVPAPLPQVPDPHIVPGSPAPITTRHAAKPNQTTAIAGKLKPQVVAHATAPPARTLSYPNNFGFGAPSRSVPAADDASKVVRGRLLGRPSP
jgi:hypothetical protein